MQSPNNMVMLGDMLSEIMDNRIRPQREKFDSISQFDKLKTYIFN